MLSGSCRRLASALWGTLASPSVVARRSLSVSRPRPSTDKNQETGELSQAFDPALLDFLVCPLSKKPLR